MSFLCRPTMYVCRQLVRYSSTTLKSRQTICSLCSAPGKCAVSIIRLSGPDTSIALQKLTNSDKPPAPRMALLRELINPQNGEIIDKGLVYYFPAPKSFTGEDICEFHVHGSTAVVEEMIRVLTSMNNIRQADPGEFLRRAFYNNKFDLLAIEGINDLINAATEQQRRQAVQVTYGKMRESFEAWRKVLIQCIASIEASIDFSETDNIQKDDHHVHKSILRIRDEMIKYLNEAEQAVSIKTGTKVIIYGAPNVGKSSLLNLLCRTNRAIVSEQPGTTRDIIEVPLNLGGYAARLIDTAGIRRKSTDKLEREGINRALDMLVPEPSLGIHILICSAETYFRYMDTHENKQFEDFLLDYMLELGLYDLIKPRNKFDSFFKQRTVVIMNKVDIFEGKRQFCLPKQVCLLSCRSKEGYEHFVNELIQQLKIMLPDSRESPRLTTMRQKEYLNYSVMFINKYINQLHVGEDEVVLVEILKKSLKYMNVLTGKLITDDILDAMFSEFCIGK